MVPVSDQEPSPVWLHRVLDSGWDEERRGGRMGYGPRTDVGNDGEVVGRVDPVDPVDVTAADIGADEGHQHVGVWWMNATSIGPPRPGTIRLGRPLATSWYSGSGVDARDPACYAFGDVERAIGSDGAACATLQARAQQLQWCPAEGGAALAAPAVDRTTNAVRVAVSNSIRAWRMMTPVSVQVAGNAGSS